MCRGGDHVARYRRVAVGSLPKAAVLLTVITAAIARAVKALVDGVLSLGKIRVSRNRSDPIGAAAVRERGDPLTAYQRGRQAAAAQPADGLSEESERLITTRPGTGAPVTSYGGSASARETEPENRAGTRPGGSTRY